MNSQDIEQRARDLWPKIASLAELDDSAVHADLAVLKAISGAGAERAIMHVRGAEGGDYIFKFEPRLIGTSQFQRMVSAYHKAETWMADQERFHVPKLTWAFESFGAQVFEHVAGPTAAARFEWNETNSETRAEVLRDCGAWLRHLHEASAKDLDAKPEPAKWGWVAKVANGQAELVRAGQLDVPAPKMFLGLCAMIHRLVRAADGSPLNRCHLHGDAHLGNFIYGANGLFSIDLTDRSVGPVEIDIVRLMTRVRYEFSEGADVDGYIGLPTQDWNGFAQGYGRDVREDAVFILFLALQILRDWVLSDRTMIAQSAAKKRRFEKKKSLFVTLRDAGY